MIDRQLKVRYYLAILANRLLFLEHRMYRIKPICLMEFITKVFQVTRGIFVNFHLYFDFWRVYLTDLNSYH